MPELPQSSRICLRLNARRSSVVATGTASAQSTAANVAASNDDIVVTAQKREERLKDVPISIAALTSAALESRHVTSIDDLGTVVPGVSIQDNGYQRRIEIRGISNSSTNNVGNSSLIGTYIDDADVTSGATSQLPVMTYDLARVEVLRGPQGTLFGGGSAGGTIRFITNAPKLDRFEASTSIEGRFTKDGAPSEHLTAVVNLPISSDQFAIRVAGTVQHDGGWIDQPAAGNNNINSQNVADIRVEALWKPTPVFSLLGTVGIHRSTGGIDIGEDSNGNYKQVFGLDKTPRVRNDFDFYNLKARYDFAFAELLRDRLRMG